ncbi:MAG: hypothetical protein HUU01_14160 [Saprospiraceae bacterium]|nr:hypothetical protein [Saprospiraceae bacterium]
MGNQAEATVQNKAGLAIDYRVLVCVSRQALEDAGMLQEYLQKREDCFNDEGYDHISLLQAKMLGLLDF